MKKFYLNYRDNSILQPLAGELSWTNNIIILDHTKTIQEKEFYIKMCLKERYSKRELQRQIDSAYFERFMLSQKPNELSAPSVRTFSLFIFNALQRKFLYYELIKIEQDKLAIPLDDIHRHLKDEYVLEFLDLSEIFSEKELRKAIRDNLRDFFLEFGKNLSFVGEGYPLLVDDEEFRIDLLFFHRELKCLIPVELKIGDFQPEYVGKMQFYLAALDEQIRLPDENPAVGLILCRSRKGSIVRLTLSKSHKPVRISVYQTRLPDKKLIQQRLERIKLPEKLLTDDN